MSTRILLTSVVGAMLFVPIVGRSALATGYWNVPSTICQCFGYGCGAGYHTPLVLGPISCKGCLAINERRLPYPPSPPCPGYGCQHHGSAIVPPTAVPAAAPTLQRPVLFVPPPAAQKPRPLFLQ